MSNRTQIFIDVVFVLLITFIGHYSINQGNQLEMSNRRNAINEDQIQDLFSQLRNVDRQNVVELAKNQGVIEGLLTIKDPKTEKAYMDVWHAGYYNGVEQGVQIEEVERLVSE